MKLKVGNTQFSIRSNGSFESIVNPETGLKVKPGSADGYPFAALVRERATGYFEWIFINRDYKGQCRVSRSGKGVSLVFPQLCYCDERRTSVSVRLDLEAGRDALSVIPTVDTGDGSFEIQELAMFHGTVLDLDRPAEEKVAVPDWGDGKIFHNPREVQGSILWYGHYFNDNAHYYSYTAENGFDMAYGWMAAYGRRAGLGLAFINEKMLTMEFKLSRSDAGIGLGAVFFRLRTYGETFPFRDNHPLRLGRLLLIPLAGDWHHAADVYRREYDKVFGRDLPALGDGPDRVRKLDVNLHYGILGAHAQTAQSKLNVSFSDVVSRTKAFIKRYRIKPSRVMVWLYGIGEYGHDRTNPTQRPIVGAAGGHGGFVKMCRELRKLGIGAHVEYTHPWATQQNQPGYDPEMDTGKSHKMMGVVMHNALCLDSGKTQDFYCEKVFKPFREDGVTDMFLDQATLCMGICQRTNHDHANDAEGTLGAHARGTLRMVENIRKVFGRDTFISTESHNDLGCRTMEMAVNGDVFSTLWAFGTPGIEVAPQINHYTHPEVLRMVNHGPANSLPLIAVNGCNSMLSQVWEDENAVRAYLKFKDAIALRGPGYPYGFCDDVGLSWSHQGNLVAKVFVSPRKAITVTWYARADVEDEISVDLSAHGGKGIWHIPVKLKAGDFWFASRKL